LCETYHERKRSTAVQAAVDERPRLQRRYLRRLCPMPQRRRPRRLCPMRTSPIAIGWCRHRHDTHARDDDREQGQGEALVRAEEVPRRANRKDERREPEQHECDVKALHPLQRHTVQVRHFIDWVAGSVLVCCRLGP